MGSYFLQKNVLNQKSLSKIKKIMAEILAANYQAMATKYNDMLDEMNNKTEIKPNHSEEIIFFDTEFDDKNTSCLIGNNLKNQMRTITNNKSEIIQKMENKLKQKQSINDKHEDAIFHDVVIVDNES